MTAGALPKSCKDEHAAKAPLVDRNRCEAKADCAVVCPFDVFEVRRLSEDERTGLSIRGRLNLLAHRGRQAVVVAPERCHSCGLCVTACPERALQLVPFSPGGRPSPGGG
jgi:4Fe-4S ferredoxin